MKNDDSSLFFFYLNVNTLYIFIGVLRVNSSRQYYLIKPTTFLIEQTFRVLEVNFLNYLPTFKGIFSHESCRYIVDKLALSSFHYL